MWCILSTEHDSQSFLRNKSQCLLCAFLWTRHCTFLRAFHIMASLWVQWCCYLHFTDGETEAHVYLSNFLKVIHLMMAEARFEHIWSCLLKLFAFQSPCIVFLNKCFLVVMYSLSLLPCSPTYLPCVEWKNLQVQRVPESSAWWEQMKRRTKADWSFFFFLTKPSLLLWWRLEKGEAHLVQRQVSGNTAGFDLYYIKIKRREIMPCLGHMLELQWRHQE